MRCIVKGGERCVVHGKNASHCGWNSYKNGLHNPVHPKNRHSAKINYCDRTTMPCPSMATFAWMHSYEESGAGGAALDRIQHSTIQNPANVKAFRHHSGRSRNPTWPDGFGRERPIAAEGATETRCTMTHGWCLVNVLRTGIKNTYQSTVKQFEIASLTSNFCLTNFWSKTKKIGNLSH